MAVTPAIVPLATPRQTIPYADRPFTDDRGYLTQAAYQFLERLATAAGATIANVTTIVTEVNIIAVDISAIEAALAVIEAEIAAIEAAIIGLTGGAPPAPPAMLRAPMPPLAPAPRQGLSLAQALGISYFFGG